MKKTILLLTFSLGTIASLFAQVSKHGSLRVNGTMLANEKGVPVVLRGMSYGWHCFWPRFYNAGSVAWLKKDWKINVIRAAMGIEPGENSYLQRKDWSIEKMREVIDAAIKEDIYIIIDWHSHNINLQEAKDFFGEMSAIYGKYPHIIYEIFNEPDEKSWDVVNTSLLIHPSKAFPT